MECLIAFRLQLGRVPFQLITIRIPTREVQHESTTFTRKIGYLGRQTITLDLKGVQIFLGTGQLLRDRGQASRKVELHIGYLGLRSIIGTLGRRDRRGQLSLEQCHLPPMLLLVCLAGRVKIQEGRLQDRNLL